MSYIDKCKKCGEQLSLETPGPTRIGYVCKECGYRLSFDRVHPYHAKEKTDKILEDWNDICAELDIDHFLVRGTCLGMVRGEGHVKKHWDIDVYVREKDLPRVTEKLLERGFKTQGLIYRYDSAIGSGQQFVREAILFDVIIDLPHDNQFLKDFDTITYEGKTYRVPHPAEAYLEHRYGRNWRIPH